MRAVILGLVVFALGLATAALVASPRAGAHVTDGSLSASVGPGFTIGMSASSVEEGNYTINVTDSSNIHNFHLSGPGVNKSTSIGGTGGTSWSVTLQPGTYSFQCDAHAGTMNGSLTVTSTATTTTTTTTAMTTTAPTTTTAQTTTAQTTTAHTTTERRTTTQATTSAATTEATTTAATTTVATTTEAATTASTPTTTQAATTPKPPLNAHVTKTRATSKTVSITITSNERGRAVAELFSGTQRVARAAGKVPGTLVLHAAHALKAGSYVLRLHVTAGKTKTTTSRVVRIA